ncbi:MAG: hypothetical protein GEU80_03110 [Dehalococcoidia bacterium]|nr:hypothetical protein [Dehalococcoidia bacterium]
MLSSALNVAILVTFVLGSVGWIGNGLVESRHGVGVPWLRYLRNGAVVVMWPLLVLRLTVG